MTVSSSTNRASYSGNGSLTTFAYGFKVFDQDDLTVILRASNGTETVQTITTHYTVTGVGDVGGGNVVFGTAPASGVTVVILREMDLEQGLDLVPNDPFPAQSLEDSLDKLTFMVQQHDEQLGRAIKASRTNVITGSEFVISAADRANKVFAFDSSGDVSITQEIGTFRGDWAASTAYVERDLVKDTTTNDVFIVNSAHTSSGSLPLTTNTNSAKYEKIIDISNPPGDLTVGGNISTSGSVTAGSFVIGSADINENDLESIDSITAGTVAASKAVVVDVNKDISSFRNLTATGDITFGGLSDGAITVTDILDEDDLTSNSATSLATQQSIKAYVDSQVGSFDTLAEVLANGNTTGGTNLSVSTGDDIKFADGSQAIFGAGDDLRINHTGSNSYISDLGEGPLFIGGNDEVSIMNGQLNEYKIKAETNGAVTLYYDNAVKMATTTLGIDVTGTITFDGGETTADLYFGDNDKAIFGAGSDLQIYHDGNSKITDVGDGKLELHSNGTGVFIQKGATEYMAQFLTDGAVTLYHDNAAKLATTSTGIDVTGTVTTDGLTADAPLSTLTGLELTYLNATKAVFSLLPSTGEIRIGGTETNYFPTFYSSGTERMRIDSSGNVGIGTSSPSSYGKFVVRGSGNIMNLDATSGPVYAAFKENTTNRFFLATLNGSDGLAFVDADGSSERMRIDSSGNVGIDFTPKTMTANVTSSLNVGSGTVFQRTKDTYLGSNMYYNASDVGKSISTGYGLAYYHDVTNGAHKWFTSAVSAGSADATHSFSTPMTIDSSGSFQLSPASNQGTFRFGNQQGDGSGIGAQFYLDNSQSIWYNSTSSTADKYHAQFINGNGLVGHIKTNGSATSYNTSSDYRLKTDAQPMTGASARVQALNPVNFEWIADGTRVDGFLAHEAQAIVPEAVTGTKDAMRDEEYEVTPAVLDDDGNETTAAVMGTRSVPDYQGIDQSKLVPLLTAALQEALTKIDALETRITALEG